jgi:hypothetical protein
MPARRLKISLPIQMKPDYMMYFPLSITEKPMKESDGWDRDPIRITQNDNVKN